EDGIRDFHVTGVQTCALPIFIRQLQLQTKLKHRFLLQKSCLWVQKIKWKCRKFLPQGITLKACGFLVFSEKLRWITLCFLSSFRSEERRVGKEFKYSGLEYPR